jgi:hypothetical protein
VAVIEGNTIDQQNASGAGGIRIAAPSLKLIMTNHVAAAGANNLQLPATGQADSSLVAGGVHQGNNWFLSGSATTSFVNFLQGADTTTNPGFASPGGGNWALAAASGGAL